MKHWDGDECLQPGTPPRQEQDRAGRNGCLGASGCTAAVVGIPRLALTSPRFPVQAEGVAAPQKALGSGGAVPKRPASQVVGCRGRTQDTVAFCWCRPREQGPGLCIPSLHPRRWRDWRPAPRIWGLKSRQQPEPQLTRRVRRQASSGRAHAPQQVRWWIWGTGLAH